MDFAHDHRPGGSLVRCWLGHDRRGGEPVCLRAGAGRLVLERAALADRPNWDFDMMDFLIATTAIALGLSLVGAFIVSLVRKNH